jgi:hypothetical protein
VLRVGVAVFVLNKPRKDQPEDFAAMPLSHPTTTTQPTLHAQADGRVSKMSKREIVPKTRSAPLADGANEGEPKSRKKTHEGNDFFRRPGLIGVDRTSDQANPSLSIFVALLWIIRAMS